jgi:MOSC domain-containing protein YiiM
MATVERLWLKPARRAPMREVDDLSLVVGHGIEGNADASGRRQVTLIDRERWDRACADLEADIDPALRRANVLIDGIDLVGSRGRTLSIGGARLRIGGENRPCRLMDDFHPGLQMALDLDWGGGAYATVIVSGTIDVASDVRWAEREDGA